MAELLVLTQRRGSNMFAGDVVTAQADGWPWTAGELRAPHWTVIKVPGAPVVAFMPLLEPVTMNGRELLYRRLHLELLKLGPRPSFDDINSAIGEKIVTPLLS